MEGKEEIYWKSFSDTCSTRRESQIYIAIANVLSQLRDNVLVTEKDKLEREVKLAFYYDIAATTLP